MNEEMLANHCEGAINTRLQGFTDTEVVRFTESCVMGRRYIAIKTNSGDFFIEINVTKVDKPERI